MPTSPGMAQVDATIEAVFGPPPEGLDLTASVRASYDIVSCLALGLSAVAVAIRFYIRTLRSGKTKNLGADDYTILLGLVSTSALVATALIAGGYGSGKHVWSTDVDRLMTLLKVVFAEPWVYAAAVTSTKISILLLYRRLFYIPENKLISNDHTFNVMFWTATFFTCTYPIIMWTVMACACRPVSFYWRQYTGATDGICIDVLEFYLVFGIINMVNDIIILSVPIPRIMKLHMNPKKKASVAGIMLLGSFVCVASIVRIYYLKRLTSEADVTWILGPAFAWSSLEPSIAIISACLPTFAPLFYNFRKKGSSNSANERVGSGHLHSGHIRLQDYSQQLSSCSQGQSQFRIEDETRLRDKDDLEQMQRQNVNYRDSHAIAVKTQIQIVTTDD